RVVDDANARQLGLLRDCRDRPCDRNSNNFDEISPAHETKPKFSTTPIYRCRIASSETAVTAHVRFGSKADICSAKRHVRFTPESDIKCDIWNVRYGPIADIASLTRSPRRCG